MSLSVNKISKFRHPTLELVPKIECNINPNLELQLLGGLLQDTRHVWHAKGPFLEVRNTKTGCKVGAWIFGCILKDSNTNIVCVEEVQRPHGRLSLLAVGLDCAISGGLICIFDVCSSKVIRAIQIEEKISNLHVIDPGIEDLNLPGPLRNFDGILAIGTEGGSIILVDLCRQTCEEALYSVVRRDELNPCQLVLLTAKNIPKIEYYKERSVRDGNHLAIHLNAVLDSQTEHFILKGPKGEDRLHVNKEEVVTSGLYYCSQLASLLVGYNFGAFQLWDLTTLSLVYTSPVSDEHLPITRFALQEPADDPRAFCYIWLVYGKPELDQVGLPFAVMYSLCYDSKEYHEGYGFLYQDFQHCSIRFQVELGPLEDFRQSGAIWGHCLGLQPITKLPGGGKEMNSRLTSGDTLALCMISWTVCFNQTDQQTYLLIFDLNQWYKEQMPCFTKWKDSSNYLLRLAVSDTTHMTSHKTSPFIDVLMDTKSLRQFVGVQRLEEHFYPTSLSFSLLALRENDVVLLHNTGLQQSLLRQLEMTGPLSLLKPSDVSRQVLSLGLTPLFSDELLNSSFSTSTQRELILNVGLEHQLVGWLCKCASEWANGSFASAGCSLDFILHWAFQRAVVLKTNCDKYCAPLFDHSQSQLDNNTTVLLNSCIRQINNLCTVYSYIVNKLSSFLSNQELIEEQRRSLQMVYVYFEVLQWLVNVGLLPEYAPSMYPKKSEKIGAPYPVQELKKFYDEKRTQLQQLNEETFSSTDSLLFIDNLIGHNCGGGHLQRQWQEDNGSGLYPPPSLQSLIRTYLIDVADIKHKHSLVIYLFLDLAMALEKSRYSPVIMYLIKFPAVFKVSTSIIKITQAFWQLDHGDFTTAMEQLLDPFVLGEDLQPWHHTIAMRSLCVQKQFNFALLYIQTRRPPMTDSTDLLTAISLFVANKMLDEAFYFMKQHGNNIDDKLLMHLFNECNKNDCLHDLLYKNMDVNEEQAFIKYLKELNTSTSDELQVFYYLLRSRYLEAFDFHDAIRKVNDRQGLIGQSNVSLTDQVVRIFKSLLPDVSRNLVEYVRKERSNLWKEVSKPTPLSVFVHNTKEQVRYKSTLIHAALAKAKHTFQDNFNDTKFGEVLTEETPFLRTPRAFRNGTRVIPNVITPNVIELNENGEGIGPSPPKKMKLSPRQSVGSPQAKMNLSMHSIMLTPIVKRKTSFPQDQSDFSRSYMNACTPQSILKGKNLDFEEAVRDEISQRKSTIVVQSRRSVSRTPRSQHVQFQDSFSDQSSKRTESMSLEDQILHKSSLSSKDISCMISSKDSTNSTNEEDRFYSPNTSIEEPSHEKSPIKEIRMEDEQVENDVKVQENVEKEESREDRNISEAAVESPRGRKTYKRSFKEMSPIRSSPRLAKITGTQLTTPTSKKPQDESKLDIADRSEISTSNNESMSTDSLTSIQSSPRVLPKVKGRRSLSRQVLENNTFSRMCTPTSKEVTTSKEISFSRTEKTVAVETSPSTSKVTTVETSFRITDRSQIDPNTSLTQKSHTVSGSVSKTNIFETSVDSTTSLESDVSFDNDPQTGANELDLSDSVKEYMKSVYSQLAGMDGKNNSQPEVEEFNNVETTEEKSYELKQSAEDNDCLSAKEEGMKVSENERPESHEENFTDEQRENKSILPLRETESETDEYGQNKDKSEEVISMEVYEDLSTDSEEVESGAEEEPSCYEASFDELEVNVFETTEYVQQTPLKKPEETTTCFSSPYSDSFDLPDTEKAFIEENTPEDGENVFVDEAIVISSEDEDLNEDRRSEDSGSSSVVSGSSSEESGSSEHVKFCFEQNIQVDETSQTTSSYKDDLDNANEDVLDIAGEDVLNIAGEDDLDIAGEDDLDNAGEGSTLPCSMPFTSQIVSCEEIKQHEDSTTSKCIDGMEKEVVQVQKIEDISPGEANDLPKDENSKDITVGVEVVTDTEEKILNDGNDQAIKGDNTKSLSEKEIRKNSVGTQSNLNETTTTNVDGNYDNLQGENENNVKKNQSTNTSFKETASAATNLPDNEQNIAEQTLIEDVERPSARKVYTSKGLAKINLEDSSSDTTEGESVRKEIIVTAQVHTPSKKRNVEPLIKRITRRSSILMSQSPITDAVTDAGDAESSKNVSPIDVETKGKVSLGSSSASSDVLASEKSKPRKPRTRSQDSSSTIDCQPSSSKETLDVPKVATLLRRTRSASVDEVKTYSRKRTLKRSNSVDERVEENVAESKPKSRSKARSVSQLPIITEEAKTKESDQKTYTTSRRLTRRQASLVKRIQVTVDDDDSSAKALEVDDLDPIKLLDKEPFQGEPDPDENKVYEASLSPSNSTASSFHKPTRRKGRSASVVSDNSATLSLTPEKRPRQTRSHLDSPKTSGVKTRSRKQSETSSVTSEKSTPPKRSRKKQTTDSEAEAVSTPTKRTRSRADSASSVKSDSSVSAKKTLRSKRLVTAKSELPEIAEEKILKVPLVRKRL